MRIHTEDLAEQVEQVESTYISCIFGRLPRSENNIPSGLLRTHPVRRSCQARVRCNRALFSALVGKVKVGYQKYVGSALNGATIDALQKLSYDRMQETHVLGTAYRKTIHAEVTDHFRYALERLAKLSQDVGVQLLVLLDAHMHETASASATILKARLHE